MHNRLENPSGGLEKLKKTTSKGGEYWMGRDIQHSLGYETWEHFEHVIERAIMACVSSGGIKDDHFRETTKMVTIGSGAQRARKDFFLDRYACYLIAMNGESTKPEIGAAQTYFAIQTRKQEIQEAKTPLENRLDLRKRVSDANKSLGAAAKTAGVKKFGLFHDAGYKGLYSMGLTDIKKLKGLLATEDLLDRAGRAELAANEFRITQAEQKIIRDNIKGENAAINTHREVASEVRETIKKIGGTMPEDLSPEPSLKKLQNDEKKKHPKINISPS